MDLLDLFNFFEGCWNIINLLFTAIGNVVVFIFSILAFQFNFILYMIRLAFAYISFVVQVIPPFLMPIFCLIFYIRIVKFILGRGNSSSRHGSSRVMPRSETPKPDPNVKLISPNPGDIKLLTWSGKTPPSFDVNSPKVYKK